jgi:HAD superfamily hydrolase (TIGR01509 family)
MITNLREIGLAPMEGQEKATGENFVYFDAMVNGNEVERKKPYPDIFLEAARRINTAPEYCWVVEDSIGGIQAARSAGMRCLALLTSFSEAEVKNAGPDIIVRDLSFIEPEKL